MCYLWEGAVRQCARLVFIHTWLLGVLMHAGHREALSRVDVLWCDNVHGRLPRPCVRVQHVAAARLGLAVRPGPGSSSRDSMWVPQSCGWLRWTQTCPPPAEESALGLLDSVLMVVGVCGFSGAELWAGFICGLFLEGCSAALFTIGGVIGNIWWLLRQHAVASRENTPRMCRNTSPF